MTTAHHPPPARRITITLDAVDAGTLELARAARLAARLGAELEGVFVEDLDLLQVAMLPFARELRAISLVSEALSAPRIERELRVQARRAERALREQAGQAGIACSFRVWRGSLGSGLLHELAAADVLALGPLGGLYVRRRRLPALRPAPIALLASETELGQRALETALGLAGDSHSPLLVIAAAGSAAAPAPLSAALLARLERSGLAVRFVRPTEVSMTEVRQTLDAAGSPVLVLPGDHRLLGTTPLRQLIAGLGCQLLVVH